jgi:hypothetical protein
VHTGTVVALGMKGNIKMGIGIKHGWTPIGIPRKVTKSKGAILYELDGRPAINIYEEYFGDLANEIKTEKLAKLAITYPLGMRIEGHDEMLIRDALTVDNDGSITCTAEIPEGSEIQLMIGSHEEAIKVANEAAKKAIGDLEGSSVKAVLVFSSIARWKLFGDRAGEEIVAIKEAVGSDTPLVGFYTYGEEAPLGGVSKNIKSCYSTFHNETVLICAFSQ